MLPTSVPAAAVRSKAVIPGKSLFVVALIVCACVRVCARVCVCASGFVM